jgi:AraC-like DNA-binding protein
MLPWKSLGVKPEPGRRIGFDVFQTSREDSMLPRIFSSLSGAPSYVNDNPSEWATLVLKKPARNYTLHLIFIIAFILAIAVFFISRKRKRDENVRVEYAREGKDLIEIMKEYIQDHFKEPDFNLKKLAAHFKFSYNYASTLFKKETGTPFPEYLQNLRVEEAKKLLAGTDEKVGSIAFKVGFGSEDYFIRVFKDKVGQTPSEFRKKG